MNLKHWWFKDFWPHEVYEVSMAEWAKLFDDGEARTVAKTTVGDAKVSTVFLGIDHGDGRGSQPLIWETMVFASDGDEYTNRYWTYEQAANGHVEVVKRLMTGQSLYEQD